MNAKRPLSQVIAIACGTLLLALAGVMLLIGEVRQGFLHLLKGSIALLKARLISPAAWGPLAVLVLGAIAYWGVRKMALAAIPSLSKAHECPECGNHLEPVSRRPGERLLAAILCSNVLRYSCVRCQWTGLRRHRHRR